MINFRKKKLLGELLVQKQIITQEQLEAALEKQKELGALLGQVLLELGYIDQESTLLPVLAEQQGMEYVYLKQQKVPLEVINKVPVKVARRYEVFPVGYDSGVVTLAMNKPTNILIRDELKMMLEMDVHPVLATRKDIRDAIREYYGVGAETIEGIMDQAEITPQVKHTEEVADLEKMDSEATISNFFNQVILEAYRERATDVHIEPFENKLIVRYRIDGMLYDIHVPPDIAYFKESLNSRIKIMCSLDISEKRRPQDGRFRIRAGDIELDLRVSFLPTPYGESVVIRVLNTTRLLSFDNLNLSDEEKNLLNNLIRKPNGIIFITGPTGSGKTTTLYSCLSQINTVDKKIITLEDPIEYQLPGITQIQVNPVIDLNFARGLRSILRHNPDIIMVGEVRDVETAEISIQVALTGHLVLSTLHTNDAPSGVTRLLNMGIEPYLITSTVECFIAQRLVRLVCPKCKVQKKMHPHIIHEFEHNMKDKKEDVYAYYGKGCEECNFTGYWGRTAIFEFFLLNEEIVDMILNRTTSKQLKEKAIQTGMKTLRESGWEKIKLGLTTPEEVIRVTQDRSKRK